MERSPHDEWIDSTTTPCRPPQPLLVTNQHPPDNLYLHNVQNGQYQSDITRTLFDVMCVIQQNQISTLVFYPCLETFFDTISRRFIHVLISFQ